MDDIWEQPSTTRKTECGSYIYFWIFIWKEGAMGDYQCTFEMVRHIGTGRVIPFWVGQNAAGSRLYINEMFEDLVMHPMLLWDV